MPNPPRTLEFSDLAALSRELDRLEAAHRAGTLKRLGNHDAGPNFDHIAMAIRCGFDGYPTRGPWLLRTVGPLVKRRVLAKPLPAGIRLGASDESKAWNDRVSFDEGLATLRTQIARLAAPGARCTARHPIFGHLSQDLWLAYHLRHAALHLGFLDPGPG